MFYKHWANIQKALVELEKELAQLQKIPIEQRLAVISLSIVFVLYET